MKYFLRFVMTLCLLQGAVLAEDKVEFIENNFVKVGVNLNGGGSIFHISEKDGKNYVNHYDRGRYVQQSYYGDTDGSNWNGNPWCWNPVQGGNWQGKDAKLLDYKKTENTLYTKSNPMHWASGELIEDCIMEQWIELKNDVIKIKFKFVYSGKKKYKARHQELPAVFVPAECDTLYYYSARNKLEKNNDMPWENKYAKTFGDWFALINSKDGKGLGVLTPKTNEITYYRRCKDKMTLGEKGSACSYVAPIRTLAIVPRFKLEYTVYFKIGTLAEIEKTFKSIKK